MNCSQARALLATYRELKNHPTETLALEAHLAHCDACKDAFAQSQFIGERIRSMPSIEPSSDAHSKLMQALAAEHVRFLQRTSSSATSTPTPAFLAPYLNDLAQKTPHSPNLAAFSTADTGPLPILQPHMVTRPRRTPHLRHMAILGLAASFLIVVMMGGLTSLLLLAGNDGTPPPIQPATVVKPSLVYPNSYTKTTTYPHVASAVANDNTIYYTTYNTDATSWMLEKINTQDKGQTSSPLLTTSRTAPILLLGASKEWLLWLQIDKPKSKEHLSTTSQHSPTLEGEWSLHATNIKDGTNLSEDTLSSITLRKDTFNLSSVPTWIHTPIQGLHFYRNHVLLSFIDGKGIARLFDYALGVDAVLTTTEIAHSSAKGRVLTSPTSNTDGSIVYWSEAWVNDSSELMSNIWTQQEVEALPERQGRWAAHTKTEQYLFREDGNSFRPQVVGDVLFMLNRIPTQVPAQATASATQTTPTPKTATQTPVATTTASVQSGASTTPTQQEYKLWLGGASRIDPMIYQPQIDALISGKLQTFSANGALHVDLAVTNTTASNLQSGSRFLIWQNTAKHFEMYDVVAKTPVEINQNDIPNDAAFLTVNADTAVWSQYIAKPKEDADTNITFNTFKWPKASSK